MSNISKRIRIDDDIVNKSAKSVVHEVRWNGHDILIRESIGAKDITNVINNAFMYAVDEQNKESHPEFLRFGMMVSVISTFTNIDLPEDFEATYSLLHCTDLYNVVTGKINKQQLDEITEAIRVYTRM